MGKQLINTMTINKNKMFRLVIIIVIIMIPSFIGLRIYDRDVNKKIFSNPGFAIGELTYFSEAKNGIGAAGSIIYASGVSSDIKYVYTINNKIFENEYGQESYKVPDSGPIAGEKYLVIYFKSDPKKSRMLFDYPIKDSTDFLRYLEKLKNNPSEFVK